MDKLDLIIQKLESLESGQKELNSIVHTIRDRQEETDAKIEAIAMDLHKARGEISELRDVTALGLKKMERRMKLIESDLDETMLRVEKQ